MGNIWETMTMRRKTKLFFASQSLIGFLVSPAGQHCVTNFAQNKQNNKSSKRLFGKVWKRYIFTEFCGRTDENLARMTSLKIILSNSFCERKESLFGK